MPLTYPLCRKAASPLSMPESRNGTDIPVYKKESREIPDAGILADRSISQSRIIQRPAHPCFEDSNCEQPTSENIIPNSPTGWKEHGMTSTKATSPDRPPKNTLRVRADPDAGPSCCIPSLWGVLHMNSQERRKAKATAVAQTFARACYDYSPEGVVVNDRATLRAQRLRQRLGVTSCSLADQYRLSPLGCAGTPILPAVRKSGMQTPDTLQAWLI